MTDPACALCGEPILEEPGDPERSWSEEHVPPLQFYPKQLRPSIRKELWTVPSHRGCNVSYKADEEYFYHRFYPLVGVNNPPMGAVRNRPPRASCALSLPLLVVAAVWFRSSRVRSTQRHSLPRSGTAPKE
jgi:hypothetical protein